MNKMDIFKRVTTSYSYHVSIDTKRWFWKFWFLIKYAAIIMPYLHFWKNFIHIRSVWRSTPFTLNSLPEIQREDKLIYKSFIDKISFILYPAHGRVVRGNLVLSHSVPHFLPNSRGNACWVAELNATLCFNTRAKKWKYKFK